MSSVPMSHHGQPKAVEECVRPKALQQQLEQRVAAVLEAFPLLWRAFLPLLEKPTSQEQRLGPGPLFFAPCSGVLWLGGLQGKT